MKHIRYVPTRAQVEAAAVRQRAERTRLAHRVDDAPETIMFDDRYGTTPGFDTPISRWARAWRRVLNLLK